jgi:hypothetical protein
MPCRWVALATKKVMSARRKPIRLTQNMKENAMSDFDKKATQKASETVEKVGKAAEEAVRSVEESYSSAFDNIRNLNVKLIDTAQANADAVCALARDIATVKNPSDLLTVWTNHAQKQFDLVTKQASDLTALGQKLVTGSTAPMTRSLREVFTQRNT